ncbi:CinA family protein [Cupriavidus sp. NPDC089707]|uniref:CinA family protein n=1 Tax=Cupriavidus sp. NPDC089707 TaxID=3363963 RepID=UPI003803E9CD
MTSHDAPAGPGDHRSIARYLRRHGLHVVTAESCTAGLIASRIAEVPGCGDVLYCAIVAYSPSAKEQLLRVPAETPAATDMTTAPTDTTKDTAKKSKSKSGKEANTARSKKPREQGTPAAPTADAPSGPKGDSPDPAPKQ